MITLQKTNAGGWPSPDVPFREDVQFTSHQGQRAVDGKSYYPTLLRLKLAEHDAWRLVEELHRQLRDGTVGDEIAICGELNETEEG